jgi:hypothetical protein
MIARRSVPHLQPVGMTGIPRAEKQINAAISSLRVAQFDQDPLFDAADSFRHSLEASAVKHEGRILEAAIMDAVEQTPSLRLLQIDARLPRKVDAQFEMRSNGWLVALEVKRGHRHDSGALRQFRSDLVAIPPMLRTALPLFPAENVHFHIVFVSGQPPLREGMTLDDLGSLYGLHTRSHVLTARQRYSAAIKHVLRERGL